MLALLNEFAVFLLSGFVLCSAVCRVDAIRAGEVRYRYVAVPMLSAAYAGSALGTMLGGDDPNWYQPFALLALGLVLFNDRHEWENGTPEHARSDRFVMRYPGGEYKGERRLRLENVTVLALFAGATAAAAFGAMQGQGYPLQFFSARADPQVLRPGGRLEIVYDIRRVRACSGYVDRFILNPGTNSVVQTFERQPVGSLRPGKRATTRVSLILADLPQSAYIFRAVVKHSCPDGDYVQYTPDVPFTVADVSDPWSLGDVSPVQIPTPGDASQSVPPVVKVPKK